MARTAAAIDNVARRAVLAGGTAAVGAALAGGLGGCARRMSGLLTSSDTHPAGYPTVDAVEYMGARLAQQTGGRLGIKVYAGGQLGSETDTLELTIFGGLDVNRVNLAPLNSMAPLTIPFSLPFIFDSVDHMRRTVDGPIGDAVLASLAANGLIGLCFYDSGARSFYNSRRAITTPADMRGLKLRVPGSDVYVAMVNALGGNAVPIPFGEVYQALAQGVIDGAENNWPSFLSPRHNEVAKYLSLTEHFLTPEIVVMGKASWDQLTPADQQLVRAAARESVGVMRQKWDARVEEAKAAVAGSDVAVNPVDKAAFAALMPPVWRQFLATPAQQRLADEIRALGDTTMDARNIGGAG